MTDISGASEPVTLKALMEAAQGDEMHILAAEILRTTAHRTAEKIIASAETLAAENKANATQGDLMHTYAAISIFMQQLVIDGRPLQMTFREPAGTQIRQIVQQLTTSAPASLQVFLPFRVEIIAAVTKSLMNMRLVATMLEGGEERRNAWLARLDEIGTIAV